MTIPFPILCSFKFASGPTERCNCTSGYTLLQSKANASSLLSTNHFVKRREKSKLLSFVCRAVADSISNNAFHIRFIWQSFAHLLYCCFHVRHSFPFRQYPTNQFDFLALWFPVVFSSLNIKMRLLFNICNHAVFFLFIFLCGSFDVEVSQQSTQIEASTSSAYYLFALMSYGAAGAR